MKRIAIIDVGSNSARLVIMEVHTSHACNLVYNQKDPLRLALKTDRKGYLTEEAFAATTNCLKNFARLPASIWKSSPGKRKPISAIWVSSTPSPSMTQ